MAERPEDLNLPTAVVSRIVKDALPDGVNVSKEARAAIAKAASVFVLYATSCANNFAMKAKRKTLTGPDVLSAMEDMEFEKFVEPLKENLKAYRRDMQGKKEATEKRRKDTVATTKSGGGVVTNNQSTTEDENETSKEEEEEESGSGSGSGEEESGEEDEEGGDDGSEAD